jgi:hypothetical protein
MRAIRGIFAVLLILLAVIAMLAPYGFGGEFGLSLHFIPASTLMDLADSLHLYLSPDGSIVRSAHGPPFLSPLGVLLVYAFPGAILGALAMRGRRIKPPR